MGSRANDFHTTADAAKCTNEGQRKLDVCTLDGQQRRSKTFQVAKVKKALGSAVEKTRLTSRTSEPMRKYGCDRKNSVYVLDLMVAHPQRSNDRSIG